MLTCAHVIKGIGELESIRVNGQPVQLVCIGDQNINDCAVLQVQNYRGGAAPLSLEFGQIDRFLTIGYGRLDFPSGASIDGIITDVNPQSNFGNLPMLRLRIKANSQQVQKGFSGSPVFDAESRHVVGLIAAYDNTEGALAIPLKTVLDTWPALQYYLNQPPLTSASIARKTEKSTRIFISYRSEDPDLSVAQQFYEGLNIAGHRTFMAGESLKVGDEWPQRIRTEVEQCDYFLLLVSSKSASSEMVLGEVRRAKRLRESRIDKTPKILPVRIELPIDAPLNSELDDYLYPFHQLVWNGNKDSLPILQEVLSLIGTEELPQPEGRPIVPPAVEAPDSPPLPVAAPELPEGKIKLASTFYVERPPNEGNCYKEIEKPGALIRIKAPRQMGKTSLLARILNHARQKQYVIISLNFQLESSSIFSEPTKFIQWLCESVGRKLNLPNRVAERWSCYSSEIGNCTTYFEEYLLSETSSQIVLGLDEVDRTFAYPKLAADFLGMLRGWHEAAKESEVWEKLRLIVVHSTEVFLDPYQSPLNGVGLGVQLADFTKPQVRNLAQRYKLKWSEDQIERLMTLINGHPYLVRVAMYHVASDELTFDQFLQSAPTEAGKYGDHLRRHLFNLDNQKELQVALKRVVKSSGPVTLDARSAFKLERMGLIRLHGNDAVISCELYRAYFSDRLRDI